MVTRYLEMKVEIVVGNNVRRRKVKVRAYTSIAVAAVAVAIAAGVGIIAEAIK